MIPVPKRRWQFTLRTLFTVVTVVGILSGCVAAYPLESAFVFEWAAATAFFAGIVVGASRAIERRLAIKSRPEKDVPPPAPHS